MHALQEEFAFWRQLVRMHPPATLFPIDACIDYIPRGSKCHAAGLGDCRRSGQSALPRAAPPLQPAATAPQGGKWRAQWPPVQPAAPQWRSAAAAEAAAQRAAAARAKASPAVADPRQSAARSAPQRDARSRQPEAAAGAQHPALTAESAARAAAAPAETVSWQQEAAAAEQPRPEALQARCDSNGEASTSAAGPQAPQRAAAQTSPAHAAPSSGRVQISNGVSITIGTSSTNVASSNHNALSDSIQQQLQQRPPRFVFFDLETTGEAVHCCVSSRTGRR